VTRLTALLVALALLLAGCGSDSEEGSAEMAWADGFCTALDAWRTSLTSIGATLKDVENLSAAKVEQAAGDLTAANDQLADDVQALGRPPETAGPEARAAVQSLSNSLEAQAAQIEAAVQGISSSQEVLQAVTAVSGAIVAMSTDISATLTELESLDAKEEWQQAFEDAPACRSLQQR
jgi:small-conductance mechanosensitive channel